MPQRHAGSLHELQKSARSWPELAVNAQIHKCCGSCHSGLSRLIAWEEGAPERRFTVGGSAKSVARCHRTVLVYWKFESISLQGGVMQTFGPSRSADLDYGTNVSAR